MKKLLTVLACTAALCAMPATAAIILDNDGVILESGPPFEGGGSVPDYEPIYNNVQVNATTVTGDLVSGPTVGSLVTFSSTDDISLFGNSNGFAQIVGPFSNLIIDPELLINAIDYTFTTGPGDSIFADITVALFGGGTALFSNVELGANNDRFRIYATDGELFENIAFNFTGPVESIRQVRIQTAEPTGAVPEPTTWAMLLFGFGAIGAAMRRRKSGPRIRLQLA